MNKLLPAKRLPWLPALFALLTAGAWAAPAASNLPVAEAPPPPPLATLVWVGVGKASVWAEGGWRAAPAHDYEFSVTQRRYGERWESIKVQHRRHPGYDGSAGARDQVHYFRVDYTPVSSSAASAQPHDFRLQSSLGQGQGQIDRRFVQGLMDFDARGVSFFAPFNRYRITQRYDYTQGRLVETVELFKRSGDRESPFMRFEEQASLFSPGPVQGVPGLP